MCWPAWLPLLLGALLFPLLPGYPLGPFPGLPLDGPSLAALAVVGALFFGWRPHARQRSDRYLIAALALLCAAKVATHVAGGEYGLKANYYTGASDDALGAEPERSFDYPGLDATRLDRELRFDARSLPVYFWNDHRFNFWHPSHPEHAGLPVRVEWKGYLHVHETGRYVLRLAAQGPASVAVGDVRLALAEAGVQDALVDLTSGAYPIAADYFRPYQAPVGFEVAWGTRELMPLAAPYLLPAEVTAARWLLGRAVQFAATGLAGLYLVVLALLAGRLVREWRGRAAGSLAEAWERPALALVLLAGIGWSAVEARPFAEEVAVFVGANDWFTFEASARDVGLYGPLQLRGAAVGAARPITEQPAYTYALAALHLLTGDPIYGPMLIQHLLLSLEVVLVYYIARRLFGRPAAIAAAALFACVALIDFRRTAHTLLSENLFQLLLPCTVLALLALVDRPRVARALGAGALLGLVLVTRYTALLYLPVALGVAGWEMARRAGARRAAALSLALLAPVAAMLLLLPLRNALATGSLVALPPSAGTNLLRERGIPPSVDLSQIEVGPLAEFYRGRGWGPADGEAVALEHLRQHPEEFLGVSLHFVGYALGVQDLGVWGRAHVDFVPIVVFYLVAWAVWRETGRLVCWFVHGFLLAHLAMLALFGINAYPPRLVLPMYVLMPVVSGFGVVVAGRALAQVLQARGIQLPGAAAGAPPSHCS